MNLNNPAIIKYAKKNGCSLEEAREELTKTPDKSTALSLYFAHNPKLLTVEVKQ